MVGAWTVNGVGLSASDVGSRAEKAFAELSVSRSTCGSDRGPLSFHFIVTTRNGILSCAVVKADAAEIKRCRAQTADGLGV